MSHELKEGVALAAVAARDGREWLTATSNIKSIVVAMQKGQLGMVPWAKITFSDGPMLLVNLAEVEYVNIAQIEGDNTTKGEKR